MQATMAENLNDDTVYMLIRDGGTSGRRMVVGRTNVNELGPPESKVVPAPESVSHYPTA